MSASSFGRICGVFVPRPTSHCPGLKLVVGHHRWCRSRHAPTGDRYGFVHAHRDVRIQMEDPVFAAALGDVDLEVEVIHSTGVKMAGDIDVAARPEFRWRNGDVGPDCGFTVPMDVVGDQLPACEEVTQGQLVVFEHDDIDVPVLAADVSEPRISGQATAERPARGEVGHQPDDAGNVRRHIGGIENR